MIHAISMALTEQLDVVSLRLYNFNTIKRNNERKKHFHFKTEQERALTIFVERCYKTCRSINAKKRVKEEDILRKWKKSKVSTKQSLINCSVYYWINICASVGMQKCIPCRVFFKIKNVKTIYCFVCLKLKSCYNPISSAIVRHGWKQYRQPEHLLNTKSFLYLYSFFISKWNYFCSNSLLLLLIFICWIDMILLTQSILFFCNFDNHDNSNN